MATANLTSEILEELNSLPTSTQGNGQNFIFLLKKLLGNLKTELEDKFTEISNIANSITDAPETITQQLKDCRVAEKRVGTIITLTLMWDYSDITDYESAIIYVKEASGISVDWSTVNVSKTISTTKTDTYVLDGCNAGYSYQFTFVGKNKYGSVSEKGSAPVAVYYVSAMNNVPDPPTEFNVYFSKAGVSWKWKQPVGIDYSVSELRTDANPGSTVNLLEVTQSTISDVMPPVRSGTAYLYNKGYGSKYSTAMTCAWAKPIPTAPQNLAVTTTYQGLQITYGQIPEDCIGIVISINGERHYTSDEKFNFYCSTGSYEIKACYYDCFGDGTWTTAQTAQTALEIPPDAVHITNTTVFDDGVIVGKYIGDKQVVGTKIADGTITTDNISAGAVTANQIASNAITSDKVTADAITADKIATGAVTTDKLTALAVTADKLAVNSVTADKLNAEIINMAGALKIVGGNVTLDENGLTERMSNGSSVTFGNQGMQYRDVAGNTFNIVGKQVIGMAKNGQYVKFTSPWDVVPTVAVVPTTMVVNSPDYATQTITIHSYADQITQNGFYVRCYSGIENASGVSNVNSQIQQNNITGHDGNNGTITGTKTITLPATSTKCTLVINLKYDLVTNGNFQIWSIPHVKITSGNTVITDANYNLVSDSNGNLIDTRYEYTGYETTGGDNGGGWVYTDYNKTIQKSLSFVITPETDRTLTIQVSYPINITTGHITTCSITTTSTVLGLYSEVGGEVALDSNGVGLFIASDSNNYNYTVT